MAVLAFAHGGPAARALLRASPEDFLVDEELGFAADGAGEHVLVRVEKRGANTEWVARRLAQFAGVGPAAVSFAGLKDRHAVARQSFSVHLPGRADPDWSALRDEEFHVLEAARHRRKLQRGALRGNAFAIVLRELDGQRAAVESRLAAVARHGVPNYFGEQRFGQGGGNVAKALSMFGGRRVPRHERGVLLSAARSQLFNAVLAERVTRGDWNAAVAGDVFMLAGSESIFGPEPMSEALAARLERGDIAPTGPLWGSGALRSSDEAARIESDLARREPGLAQGLESAGLRQERRSLVLRPAALAFDWRQDGSVRIAFRLGRGAYATTVLREVVDWTSAGRDEP